MDVLVVGGGDEVAGLEGTGVDCLCGVIEEPEGEVVTAGSALRGID